MDNKPAQMYGPTHYRETCHEHSITEDYASNLRSGGDAGSPLQ